MQYSLARCVSSDGTPIYNLYLICTTVYTLRNYLLPIIPTSNLPFHPSTTIIQGSNHHSKIGNKRREGSHTGSLSILADWFTILLIFTT